MFDPNPIAVNPAISFAPVVTGHLPNNADGSSATQALLDDMPTPEQMWGQGGVASAPEDTTFNATPLRDESPSGCSPTQLFLVVSDGTKQDGTASISGDLEDSGGCIGTPSSAGGNPAEPDANDGEAVSDGPELHRSPVVVSGNYDPDSDDSCASIFGLRDIVHEIEEFDELSDASSQGADEITTAERGRVCKWRADNLLTDDFDFAYVFPDFDEAYSNAGRAVAKSWSKARILVKPEILADKTRFSEIEGTTRKIRRVG